MIVKGENLMNACSLVLVGPRARGPCRQSESSRLGSVSLILYLNLSVSTYK
jgi:hypothetical protein